MLLLLCYATHALLLRTNVRASEPPRLRDIRVVSPQARIMSHPTNHNSIYLNRCISGPLSSHHLLSRLLRAPLLVSLSEVNRPSLFVLLFVWVRSCADGDDGDDADNKDLGVGDCAPHRGRGGWIKGGEGRGRSECGISRCSSGDVRGRKNSFYFFPRACVRVRTCCMGGWVVWLRCGGCGAVAAVPVGGASGVGDAWPGAWLSGWVGGL